jgi:ApaG protein
MVEVFYLPMQSNPLLQDFVFAYRITIENNSNNTIKLLRRHWRIADSNGDIRHVEGEGVVGQQPIIEHNEKYQYTSGCNLKSEIGVMQGTYTVLDIMKGKNFDIEVPRFKLEAPYKNN